MRFHTSTVPGGTSVPGTERASSPHPVVLVWMWMTGARERDVQQLGDLGVQGRSERQDEEPNTYGEANNPGELRPTNGRRGDQKRGEFVHAM